MTARNWQRREKYRRWMEMLCIFAGLVGFMFAVGIFTILAIALQSIVRL